MPLYEYRCPSCSKVFEAYMRLSEEKGEEPCPACGASARKERISLFSAPGGGSGSPRGGAACGSGSRRSPFG